MRQQIGQFGANSSSTADRWLYRWNAILSRGGGRLTGRKRHDQWQSRQTSHWASSTISIDTISMSNGLALTCDRFSGDDSSADACSACQTADS
jgi:hypothetical protein